MSSRCVPHQSQSVSNHLLSNALHFQGHAYSKIREGKGGLVFWRCQQHKRWNYFDFQGPRTNNNVEGWHSRLKKVVGKPHPNLYEIIDVFKREEASTKVKLQTRSFAGWSTAGTKTEKDETEGATHIQNLFSRLNQGTEYRCLPRSYET